MIELLQRTTPSYEDQSMGFTCLCTYDVDRPQYLYNVSKATAGDNAVIDFKIDLNGWIMTGDTQTNGDDYMTKIVTFKSNNANVIGLYIDGPSFRIEVRPTAGDPTTQYFWYTPNRMGTTHWISVTAIHSKQPDGNVRFYHNGEHLHVFKNVATIEATSAGNADYWMLGLDCRQNKPPGVTYRWAKFYDLICKP